MPTFTLPAPRSEAEQETFIVQIKSPKQALSVMTLLLAASMIPALATAEPVGYKADPVHSTVGFTIRHFVSDVDGRFSAYEGAIKYDAQHPEASSVMFTVQAASISTGNDDRDKHLK